MNENIQIIMDMFILNKSSPKKKKKSNEISKAKCSVLTLSMLSFTNTKSSIVVLRIHLE